MTQEEFEQLLGKQPVPAGEVLPAFTVIYFTANWCGACKRLDMNSLEGAFEGVNWLKCDVDQNNYTPGYCQVRSIPTFLIVANQKVLGTLTSNQTEQVRGWIGEKLGEWRASKSS